MEGPPDAPIIEEAPNYDSCFDDLNVILSQSIQQPDPDPNLESSGPTVRLTRDEAAPLLKKDRAKTPRTSEIFRSVVTAAYNLSKRGDGTDAAVARPAQSHPSAKRGLDQGAESQEPNPELVVANQDESIQEVASADEEPFSEAVIAWSQVLLMSYASAITLALIWMLWTGRWSRNEAPPSTISEQAVDSSSRVVEPTPVQPALPIPLENSAKIGQTIQLGDVEATPLAVISTNVELVRSIEPNKRRYESECLVLRLRLRNVSKQHTFAPLDPNLVRERGLRPYDPYIATSEGSSIGLFPLALDSEWSIVGQDFTSLQPGESMETFVAAGPGSAQKLAAKMTWRVRLRTGVYRADMLGVPFTKDEVQHIAPAERDFESEFP